MFYSDLFKINTFSEFNATATNQQELKYQDGSPRLTKHEYLTYMRDELLISHKDLLESDDVVIIKLKELIFANESPMLSISEYMEIQELLIFQEELLKSDDVETSKPKELIVDFETDEEFSWYKANPDWAGNKLKKLNERFFNMIRDRKTGNLMWAPNANLNYDSSSTLMDSNFGLIISHIPISIFPPYISQISDINASNFKKIVLLVETIINYILVIFLFYYVIRQQIPQISFILVLFSCMLLFCLLDSNFGTYIRHAFIFLELFFGIGLLALLGMVKLNINFSIRKGLL